MLDQRAPRGRPGGCDVPHARERRIEAHAALVGRLFEPEPEDSALVAQDEGAFANQRPGELAKLPDTSAILRSATRKNRT